uniref:Uncharacterized protein n=2 Tax=Cajanus cajan TaxID=3821 RepID=A0A151R1V9_CAJCA|nr:hypothetical protein KK1_042374 [Cajanus cajan]
MLKISVNVFFAAIVSLIVVAVIADIIILWVVIKPHFPLFHLNAVDVSSLNTTITNSSTLTATFDVSVYIRNPNPNLGISYDSLEVVGWFNHHRIGSGSISPRWQEPMTEGSVQARFEVAHKVFPSGLVKGIAAQRARGTVDFGVAIVTSIRFWWHGIVRTRIRSFRLECYPLSLVFPPDKNKSSDIGRLLAPSDCYVT